MDLVTLPTVSKREKEKVLLNKMLINNHKKVNEMMKLYREECLVKNDIL